MTARTPSRTGPGAWWVGFVCGMATFVDAPRRRASASRWCCSRPRAGRRRLTPAQIGLLTGVLTAGVAVGSLGGGRLADRFGRRRVFLVTMALIVLGAATPFLGVSVGVLLPGIALIGLGVGADLPAALATISEAATTTATAGRSWCSPTCSAGSGSSPRCSSASATAPPDPPVVTCCSPSSAASGSSSCCCA